MNGSKKGPKSWEAPVWRNVRGEWRQLFGSYHRQGVSAEWHDFALAGALNWQPSFHPESLEVCFNFAGAGMVELGASRCVLQPGEMIVYVAGEGMQAERMEAERHRFLTLELTPGWLRANLGEGLMGVRAELLGFVSGDPKPLMLPLGAMDASLQSLAESVAQPRLGGMGVFLWLKARILELLSHTLFRPEVDELFCMRQKRVSQDRIQRVKALLAADLENPPALAEIAKTVGCSPFYLSRTFSQETGQTISRYLQSLRMEKAAALLGSGKYNVTEAALAVGYSSLSHFSKAFSDKFGHCPCVFPLKLRLPSIELGNRDPSQKK